MRGIDVRQIEAGVFIGAQIAVAEIVELANTGLRTLVNNRPDNEESGQPSSDTLERAALDAALAYTHVPIADGFPPEAIAAARAALLPEAAPVLLFCKSGMRSAALWALARATEGVEVDALIAAAAKAGYDLRAFRPMMLRQTGDEH